MASFTRQFKRSLLLLLCVALGCVNRSLSQPDACIPECRDDGRCHSDGDCCLSVEEGQPNGTLVGNANVQPTIAMILSGETQGTITLGTDPPTPFELNQSNGEIRTSSELDREMSGCALLTIRANLESGDATALLIGVNIVDVNDNAPYFTESSWSIEQPESDAQAPFDPMRTCSPVLQATDADEGENGRIRYTVTGTDAHMFAVDDDGCISRTVPIDRDNVTNPQTTPIVYVRFLLVATDNGNPQLTSNISITINVTDVNDNIPMLRESSLTIDPVPEDAEVGTLINVFEADDPDYNSDLRFELIESDIPFDLSSSGVLTLSDSLNHEQESSYTINVKVTDMTLSSTGMVTLYVQNVNDKASVDPPVSSNHTINENTTEFSIVYRITDTDTAGQYHVELSGVRSECFRWSVTSLFPGTYLATVTLNHAIDQEELIADTGSNSFVMNVVIIELGSPNESHPFNNTITVEGINDNLPALKKSRFEFKEEQAPGNRIAELMGVDVDDGINGTVKYYTLMSVIAHPSMKSLTQEFQNINNGPQLTILGNLNLSVSERIPTSVSLLAPTIDREDGIHVINITLNLTDGGNLSNTVYVTVDILDINDNNPTFPAECCEFTFPEGQPPAHVVGPVTASDKDSGINAEIRYKIESSSDEFAIDEVSGEMTTKQVLDREQSSEYFITIRAENVNDSSHSDSVVVTVHLSDINDNPPRWEDDVETEFTVKSDSSPETLVGFVVAVDDDLDPEAEAKISYRLHPEGPLFTIDSTGAITVQSDLANELGVHNLTAEAYNPEGPPSHTTMLNITITVESPDDYTSSSTIVYASIGGVSLLVVIAIAVATLLLVGVYCKSRRQSHNFPKMNGGGPYNNANDTSSPKRGILRQVPTTVAVSSRATSANGSGRGVKFDEKVQKIGYDDDHAVTNDAVYYTESSINLGSSGDESPQTPPRPSRLHPSIHHNGKLPSDGHPHAPNGTVSLSPIEEDFFHTHPPHQRSPLMSDTPYYLRDSGNIGDYDGNSDDDSTLPDDASNINAPMPSVSHHIMRYVSSPQHSMPHMPPPQSSPPPSHLTSHVMGGLSPAHQYSHPHSPHHSNSLTLTPHNHSPHSPHSASLDSLTTMPTRQHMTHDNPRMMHQSSRGSSYPVHMPDAFGGPPPIAVGSRYEDPFMETFDGSDYGDASTYASADLDEALHFRPDLEPGIFSLTATSSVYSDDNEESQL